MHSRPRFLPIARRAALGLLLAGGVQSQTLPSVPVTGTLELVHRFVDQMPAGVALSSTGRTFISYPRWEDPVNFTLGELVNGREVAYPSRELNRFGPGKGLDPAAHFVSVQGLAVDARDRLWVLDSGTLNQGAVLGPGAAKLVGIDTATNRVVKTITFPAEVVTPDTYLNNLRVDLGRGMDGAAYISDSGERSTGGIIVVDLASGKSWRRLGGHASVRAEDKFMGVVEGQSFLNRPRTGPSSFITTGSDGLAISPDGATLYYGAGAGRRLFSVSTDLLWDQGASDFQVEGSVRDLGQKGASDGLGEDASGNVYTTDYENNAVLRRTPGGDLQTVVADPRLLWPSAVALHGGSLYVVADQFNRQGKFHAGQDLRQKPYSLFRVRTGAQPVVLK